MHIELEPIQQTDLEPLLEWVGTYEQMVQWSGPWNFEFPLDKDQLAQFFLTDTSPDGPRRMQFKAVDAESGAIVGQIGFSRIWDKTNAAHLGPAIVAPTARNAGIGCQLVRQLLTIHMARIVSTERQRRRGVVSSERVKGRTSRTNCMRQRGRGDGKLASQITEGAY